MINAVDDVVLGGDGLVSRHASLVSLGRSSLAEIVLQEKNARPKASVGNQSGLTDRKHLARAVARSASHKRHLAGLGCGLRCHTDRRQSYRLTTQGEQS